MNSKILFIDLKSQLLVLQLFGVFKKNDNYKFLRLVFVK